MGRGEAAPRESPGSHQEPEELGWGQARARPPARTYCRRRSPPPPLPPRLPRPLRLGARPALRPGSASRPRPLPHPRRRFRVCKRVSFRGSARSYAGGMLWARAHFTGGGSEAPAARCTAQASAQVRSESSPGASAAASPPWSPTTPSAPRALLPRTRRALHPPHPRPRPGSGGVSPAPL